MKIAVASDGRTVSQHFGHCEGFAIYTEKEGKVVSNEFVKNPGHKPGFLPNYLNDQGVNVIISGGMGGGAIEIFNDKGIKVITGATGATDEVVKEFISGNLKSNGSVCDHHEHHDSCGGH